MSDGFNYINRHGDTYYLQSKTGENGKSRYSFARKLTGSPVSSVPQGYEVREHPESGQVVVRKIKPSAIFFEETTLLEKVIRKQKDKLLCVVDTEERSLVVYTSDMDAEARVEVLRQMVPMDEATAQGMKRDMIANANYQKMMRFKLMDADQRLFNMDRWCFMGGIDDWYFIEGDQPLSVLAEKYVRHLGEESFFDLM